MRKAKTLILVCVGFFLLLLSFACTSNNPKASQTATNAQAKVTRGDIEVSISGTGTLIPIKAWSISPNTTGKVDKIYVKNGEVVKKGDKIAELSNGQVIEAPADGKISALEIQEDEEISAVTNTRGIGLSPDSPKSLGRVIDIDKMLVVFPVDEVDILKIKNGQEASINVDAMPEKDFKGIVVEVAEEGLVQNNVSTFNVTIELDNPEQILKSGMTSNVNVTSERKASALLIPIEALQQTGQQKYVLVSAPNGKSSKKNIKVGITNESYAEVIEGLNEGETILLPRLVEEQNQSGMGFRGPFGRSSR